MHINVIDTDTDMDTDTDTNEEYYTHLLNTFQTYFKQTFAPDNPSISMFAGIDLNNQTSTNRQLEEFYCAMCKHKEYEGTFPEMIELYQFGMPNIPQPVVDSLELYGINNNGKIEWISPSLFSIIIEVTNMIIEKPDSRPIIVNLK